MEKISKKEKIKSVTHPPLKIKFNSADEGSEFAESVINTIREPLLLLDKDLIVIKASRSFYDFFKVTPDETIGKLIYELGNHQWDIPKLRELLETIPSDKKTFDNYEVEHDFPTIGKRIMLLNARLIQRALGKEKIILLAIEDITERNSEEITPKEKKEQIEAQNEKFVQIGKELAFQKEEKKKRASELIIANKELAFQNEEKEKRASELIVANEELGFQNEEKEKRASELIVANEELGFQSEEKEKRAAELIVANKELVFQNREKERRADELFIANKELGFQNEEKEKRAAELIVANEELAFQNGEKEKRAAELIVANKELVFQNREKEKRADELIIANKELAFQNEEKEKRAAELIVANEELAFQNEEKEKRAAELIEANKELVFQNREKEKRADELFIANKELAFQSEEKEKRAAELTFANEARRETNEYLENLLDCANAPIIVWDTQYEITRFNKAFETITGKTEKDVLGKSLNILFPPTERDSSMELIRKTLDGERMEVVEINILHINGFVRTLLWNSANIFDKEGKNIIATIAQGHDITERKQAIEETHKLNKELEQRVIERTTQLEKANKELESFSYSVSHDLRAPLRHIDGFIELLKKKIFETADDSVKRYLNIISQASKKLSCLIDELLTYSRTGRTKLVPKEVDLNELVKEVIMELKPQMENRKINWQIDQLPKIQADYNLIKLVYQNLIGNSIKFTGHKEEALVLLTAKEEKGRYILTVKDNGAGFDMAFSERLFGVFQRLHRQDEFEGIGIGLANVRRIVQMHSGDIWAEGKVNEGAEFSFSIPKEFNKG
jgi:PAS domain S-box-containing protein